MKYVLSILLLASCGGEAPTASCAGAGYLGSWTAGGTGNALVLADDCKVEAGAPNSCRLKGEHGAVGENGVTLFFYTMDLEACAVTSTTVGVTSNCTYVTNFKTTPATMDLDCDGTLVHYHQ